MAKKAGYYTDKDGDTWLRLGSLGAVWKGLIGNKPQAVWSWDEAKRRWGPMKLDQELSID